MSPRVVRFLAVLALLPSAVLGAQQAAAPAGLKPLTTEAMNAWKSMRGSALSNDGTWFAFTVAPAEGDAEVVIRATGTTQEYRFPVGDGSQASQLTLSGDAKWAAWLSWPTFKDAKKLKKERKPVQATAVLLNLATGEKREIEKIRRIVFAGEKPSWVALHAATDAPAPAAPAPGAPPAAPAPLAATAVILHDLAHNTSLAVADVGEFGFDWSGEWLAYTVETSSRVGNGVQLRNMKSEVVRVADNSKGLYRRLTWADSGLALAVLRGMPDSAATDTLFAVVTWKNFTATGPTRTIYEPSPATGFPAKMKIAGDRAPRWTQAFDGLYLGIRAVNPPKAKGADWEEDEKPNVEIWHGKDARLQPQQKVQENADKAFTYLSLYRLTDQRFLQLATGEMKTVTAAPMDRWAVAYDDRAYELDANLSGVRKRDAYVIDLASGERRKVMTASNATLTASPDGQRFAYMDDGQYFVQEFAGGASRNLTAGVATTFWNDEDDHNVVKPPRFPVGWSTDGLTLLLTDGWDIWRFPVRGGAPTNLTMNGKKDAIRYRQVLVSNPRQRGLDLSKPVLIGTYGEWTKKEGLAKIDPVKGGVTTLLWDDAAIRVTRARDAELFAFSKGTARDYPDWYVAGPTFATPKRITDINPQQKEYAWSAGSRLVDYVSDHGVKLQAALFLPAGYQPGKKYPTVVYIYEKLSQGLHQYAAPNETRALNPANYTARGYAVLMPDITYEVNNPGMSAVWSVIPAVKAAAATGIVDIDKVGLQGHSWGGYQTAFLVTQTDLFKGAIAGAPLTDMISMYSSVYWNSGSANQPIFESSQGRFKGNFLENMDAYVRNSPNRFADKVKTPLIILHNDKDGAVDFNQGVTYYNTLRELGKEVIMLSYPGENHGLAKPANQKDYARRMDEFFDAKLMGKTPPDWYVNGVPRLAMEEHLKDRRPTKAGQVP
jgi:dipeptidyl aminopeptidase/acylaminoacyl peptidase